jgi:hypothetical protein
MPQWRVRDAMTTDVIPDRGVVTRSDPLKVHARLDAVVRDEVLHLVLRRTLTIPRGVVEATVDAGVVTLAGSTARKTTAVAGDRVTDHDVRPATRSAVPQ